MVETQKTSAGVAIERACRQLVYVSEIDSEIEPFRGPKVSGTDPEEFRQAADIDGAEIEQGDLPEFTERLTQTRDWHSIRDAQNAKGFEKLFRVLKKELTNIRLYRVGQTNVQIYIVGTDKKGRMRGIRMSAVET
jgi:hypothetical protein